MHLLDILPDQNRITTGLRVANKKNLIEYMADNIASFCPLTASITVEALLIREKLGSTGLGKGVAIPHARFAKIDETIGSFFQLENPIEFDAQDSVPVDLVFLLLVPESTGAHHLKILAQLSRLFKTAGLIERLRHTHDKQEIHDLLTREDLKKVA